MTSLAALIQAECQGYLNVSEAHTLTHRILHLIDDAPPIQGGGGPRGGAETSRIEPATPSVPHPLPPAPTFDHETKIDPNPGGPDWKWSDPPTPPPGDCPMCGHLFGVHTFPDLAGCFLALLRRGTTSDAAEKRIELARGALVDTGYFTPGQVGDDIAPRIVEQDEHRKGEIRRQRNLKRKARRRAAAYLKGVQAARNQYHTWAESGHDPVGALHTIGAILDVTLDDGAR